MACFSNERKGQCYRDVRANLNQ